MPAMADTDTDKDRDDDEPDLMGELRRPDLVLDAVARDHPFDRPRTLLVRVDGLYDAQRVTGTTVLWEEPAVDERDRTRRTEEALQRLGFTRSGGDWLCAPIAVAVVVRPGPTTSSWDEREAFLGLRYGSNWVDVRQGDILTVTARGWTSWLDRLWGTSPRARWSAVPTA